MEFKSLKDRFFIVLWTVTVLIINLCFLIPLIFFPPQDQVELIIAILIDLLVTAFLIWIVSDIRYTFKQDHLFIKGGIFRSRIQYKDITKITRRPNIWVGYRILFSKDAIEVHYKTGLLGSVIISPTDKEIFINELKTRNTNIFIEPFSNI
ncbi:PH domain-containing protein [Cohnella yongneupensis]|uniref:PH domain-containing protein n=1 Tax=Cohnella yongneupensis TaxID=425006 RepID=A0ABW0QZ49_9BACL